MGQLNQEPSMEDILASIKRIIAEDSEAAGARTPKPRREATASAPIADPVPVLAAPAQSPANEDVAEPEPSSDAASESVDVLELTSPIIAVPEADMSKPAEAQQAVDTLLSDPARLASRNAFAALSQLQIRTETAQENTLEGLVADLLRPMLREWLDRELPALVERMVAAEIARVSGR